MKKITILALHLGVGGIEKAIATLSNILIKKYEVEIISTYQIEKEPAFAINEKVKIKYLMPETKPNVKEFKQAVHKFQIVKILKEGIKAIRILYLRKKLMVKAIKELSCDIAISTRDIHNKWLGKYGKKEIIKIAQEHNNNGNARYVKRIVKSIKNMDYFLPVSKQLQELYQKEIKGDKPKCLYIPHCLKKYPERVSSLEEKNILAIGRLSEEKGFLDLVDIYEKVSKINPDWHLNIAGDGNQKEVLEAKINEKNLQNGITLLGFQNEDELEKLFLKSSIYVMTSIHESFGLVLIEAQSFGLPLLAFDSAQGPKEIIVNNETGFLIQNRNKDEMAKKIDELITNQELRKKLGQASRQQSEIYKMENVEKIWWEFLNKV